MAATDVNMASSYYHPSRNKEEGKQKICFPLTTKETLSQETPSRLLLKPHWSELGHMATCKGGWENVDQEGEYKSQDGFRTVTIHALGVECKLGILATQTNRVVLARKKKGWGVG